MYFNGNLAAKFEGGGKTREAKHIEHPFAKSKTFQFLLSSLLATEIQSVNESEKSWLPDVLAY